MKLGTIWKCLWISLREAIMVFGILVRVKQCCLDIHVIFHCQTTLICKTYKLSDDTWFNFVAALWRFFVSIRPGLSKHTQCKTFQTESLVQGTLIFWHHDDGAECVAYDMGDACKNNTCHLIFIYIIFSLCFCTDFKVF